MSRFIYLFLFVLVSCSEGPAPETTSLGQEKSFEPLQVSQDDDYRFQMVCAALDSKNDSLRVLAPTSYNYTFAYSEKGCSSSNLGAPRDIRTKVVSSGTSYIFQMENNEPFYFSNVELSNEGLMAEICKNAGRITTPVQTSSSGALWFSFGMDSNDCQSDENGVCIYFQRGSAVRNKPNTYLIHTEEWVKFRMINPNRGFFTQRKIRSSASCNDGDTVEKMAVLK